MLWHDWVPVHDGSALSMAITAVRAACSLDPSYDDYDYSIAIVIGGNSEQPSRALLKDVVLMMNIMGISATRHLYDDLWVDRSGVFYIGHHVQQLNDSQS